MNDSRVNGVIPQAVWLPWRSTSLALAAALVFLVLGPAPEAWVFDRTAIAAGEWWRLLTGHWVHSDFSHAAWDIAMLAVLGILFEPRLGWRLPGVLLFASAGVNAFLWWGDSSLLLYCGLSGILNGLLFAGLAVMWGEMRHPAVLIVAAFAALKILLELSGGQAILTRTAWPSVPAAHAAGMVSGLVFAWLLDKAAPGYRPLRRRGEQAA